MNFRKTLLALSPILFGMCNASQSYMENNELGIISEANETCTTQKLDINQSIDSNKKDAFTFGENSSSQVVNEKSLLKSVPLFKNQKNDQTSGGFITPSSSKNSIQNGSSSNVNKIFSKKSCSNIQFRGSITQEPICSVNHKNLKKYDFQVKTKLFLDHKKHNFGAALDDKSTDNNYATISQFLEDHKGIGDSEMMIVFEDDGIKQTLVNLTQFLEVIKNIKKPLLKCFTKDVGIAYGSILAVLVEGKLKFLDDVDQIESVINDVKTELIEQYKKNVSCCFGTCFSLYSWLCCRSCLKSVASDSDINNVIKSKYTRIPGEDISKVVLKNIDTQNLTTMPNLLLSTNSDRFADTSTITKVEDAMKLAINNQNDLARKNKQEMYRITVFRTGNLAEKFLKMVIPTLSIIPQIFTQPTDCQTVPLDSSATDLALKNIQNNLPKAGLITIIFNVDNSPQTDISTIFEMDRTHPEQLTLRFSTLLPVDQDIDNEILMKQTSQAIRKTLTQDIVKSNLEALANYLYERNSNANSKTDDSIPDDSIPL